MRNGLAGERAAAPKRKLCHGICEVAWPGLPSALLLSGMLQLGHPELLPAVARP